MREEMTVARTACSRFSAAGSPAVIAAKIGAVPGGSRIQDRSLAFASNTRASASATVSPSIPAGAMAM
jgi:hypothetical protein